MDIVFHYPPELLNLLIEAIPRMCRSKKSVLLFFRGAGVSHAQLADLQEQVAKDPDSVRKNQIVETVLTRINEKGESGLAERREVLKRVVEFEDFSTCWPEDQLKAKGLVSEIRRVVNVKDSFTRMQQEKDEERKKRQVELEAKMAVEKERKAVLAGIRRDLFSLFSEVDPQKRGKALEGVLNRFFSAAGVLVREAFTLKGAPGQGVIEQIDGVVEIDGQLYLVEMKWWKDPLDNGDVAQHLVRVFNRGHARGIFISASHYTASALAVCKESLQKAVVVLCGLNELVRLLEAEGDIKAFFKAKINAAIIEKEPLFEPQGNG